MKTTEHTIAAWHCESSLGLVRCSITQRIVCAMPHALNKRAIKMRNAGDDAEITPEQRLIAAAPELLEACQRLLDAYNGTSIQEVDQAMLFASEAIAKATGTTP